MAKLSGLLRDLRPRTRRPHRRIPRPARHRRPGAGRRGPGGAAAVPRRRARRRTAAPCSPSPPPTGRPRIWARAAADLLGRDAVAVLPSWETLPHERLSPRPDTVGRRLSIFRQSRRPGAPRRGVVVAAARSLIQPIAPGLGGLEPVDAARRRHPRLRRPAGPARRAGLHAGRDGHRRAASSPSAAGSSTSSRPRPSTRCASSSGATRSASCAASPSPTSARSTPSRSCDAPGVPGAAAHRRGARPGRGARPDPREQPAAARAAGAPRRGHPGRGHGVADPGAGRRSRAGAAHRPAARSARRCCSPTRSGSAPAARTSSAPARSSWRRAGSPRAIGGDAPIDVGASAYRGLDEVLEHAAADRAPGRHAEPAGLRPRRRARRRPCTRSSRTAATPTAR